MLNRDHCTEKMTKWHFNLRVNLGLVLCIFLCAILGRSLGIREGPALAVSVVWPATGVSLAALILFGNRAASGVFFGNFAYNLLFLILYPPVEILTPVQKVFSAIFVSLGSLLQALISAHIIRTYSTPLVIQTVRDVCIFLIPASLLSCLIGSTIGVATLATIGGLDKSLFFPVWLTFWLGDTVGIYVITPLILIWTLQQREVRLSDHIPSIVCMIFLFGVFSFATQFFGFSLPHLFLLISIWAAFLFRMHGASLAIFIMTVSSVIFAASRGLGGTSLILLISFIGVTIAASLIIASVTSERASALKLLDSRNLFLEKEVDVKVEIIELIRSEASRKRMSFIQDPESKSMALQIHASLSQIERITKSSQKALDEIQKLLREQNNISYERKRLLAENLHQIRQGLSDTNDLHNIIAEVFERLIT